MVLALDSEFVKLEVAGEGVELPSGVCLASSAGSGMVILACLSLLQVITSLLQHRVYGILVGALLNISPTLFAVPVFLFFV